MSEMPGESMRERASHAWEIVGSPVPGFTDGDRARRAQAKAARGGTSLLVGGGCLFWVIFGAFILAGYAFVVFFVVAWFAIVIGVRLLGAVLVTIGWGIDSLTGVWRRRGGRATA